MSKSTGLQSRLALGETDAAIEHIRHLLSMAKRERVDLMWAPLRGDPRFRKLAELDRK
jgi:hypothetical protein